MRLTTCRWFVHHNLMCVLHCLLSQIFWSWGWIEWEIKCVAKIKQSCAPLECLAVFLTSFSNSLGWSVSVHFLFSIFWLSIFLEYLLLSFSKINLKPYIQMYLLRFQWRVQFEVYQLNCFPEGRPTDIWPTHTWPTDIWPTHTLPKKWHGAERHMVNF